MSRSRTNRFPNADWGDARWLALVRKAIRNRAFLREPGRASSMVQTYISTVFLTPGYVFKFKRAADFGFADFRSLRRRRHFCLEELRLNRRLAPDVYLRVAALRESRGGLSFRGRGRIVDWAVVMRRLPNSAMLSQRLRRGLVSGQDMQRLARLLADFHHRARTTPRRAHYGSPEVWRMNWDENFAQVRQVSRGVLPESKLNSIRLAVEGFLEARSGALLARMERGFVRDGHGDLRCEHVCLRPAIRIIDCIEFNERFRYGDVANDLAFLLMDLESEGHPKGAKELVDAYRAYSGDEGMMSLMPFYLCYRAFVRGKVTAMRLRDRKLACSLRNNLERRARHFFSLSARHAGHIIPPRLLLVSGLMGSGKSFLAEALGKRTGAVVLASDRIRKELAGISANGRTDADGKGTAFGSGIYSTEWNQRTYEAMLERARGLLRSGQSAILDATFSRRADRDAAFRIAGAEGAETALVECRVPDRVALSRLRERSRSGHSISDGRAELYPAQKRSFDPIREVPRSRHLALRTDRSAARMTDMVLQRFPFPGSDLW